MGVFSSNKKNTFTNIVVRGNFCLNFTAGIESKFFRTTTGNLKPKWNKTKTEILFYKNSLQNGYFI